ncbi:SDR family oxidoreductase [Actinoplanes sp. TBRC 11911]|uniref:SDR family NAD(P)-dependent oxidoreductase n=1 Tax=Actinoplanes sp. TBRC 11911 TaxID=2729386 RepID=UPI00145D4C6A|nr:SDR family oxidoreductase [Actinoplanes sp. TBRC 11911]NMO54070.1 SDR family oxidoreductase [Actinoplanes sp. TBRC 11911]
MRLDLTGKTALVTGSTSGIGLAIAAGLGAAGARVGVNGRTKESVDRALGELREGDFVGVPGDVTTDADDVLAVLPRVDILINSLGIYGAQPAMEITDDDWRRYFETNVLAGIRLTRAYLPGMRERGWGRVVYIVGESAVAIPAHMIHLGMTKTALLAVSRGFAKEAAASGVTVNCVVAGPAHTGGSEDYVREVVGNELPWDEAQREYMRRVHPQSLIQRLIEPAEIANMVVYLSSPMASATTGGALRVDGGYVDSILP